MLAMILHEGANSLMCMSLDHIGLGAVPLCIFMGIFVLVT